MTTALVEKYRPRAMSEVRGQAPVIRGLSSYIKRPSSKAFLFAGEKGTGKTSAAYALARELGVDVENHEFGGFYEVASGEMTADAVRERMQSCRMIPWTGSGWRVVVCNECDDMSDKAEKVWLDALEHLPPRTTVIFTTNEPAKLTGRFTDRCECYYFQSDATCLAAVATSLATDVWKAETGQDIPAETLDILAVPHHGAVSFRKVLTALEPLLREAMPEDRAESLPPAQPEPEPAREIFTSESQNMLAVKSPTSQIEPALASSTTSPAPKWQPVVGDMVATSTLMRGKPIGGPVTEINSEGLYKVSGFWFEYDEIRAAGR